METVFVKILAAALAFSQAAVSPHTVKPEFDRDRDQRQVVELLQSGCSHMMAAFEIENINIDDLIETAMNDPQAAGGTAPEFHGLNFGDLQGAYRQFCKHETLRKPVADIGEVIDFYNQATAGLPDFDKAKLRLPGVNAVLDGSGREFAEMFQDNRRGAWIALSKVPVHVRNAFIAAEDKRFYQHSGVDDRGLVRAFLNNLTQGRREGGSTITQQLAKNMLVGDNRTYERKIRETIMATRLEWMLSKDEILELYLNSVYLGRGAWGIERAARNYFSKPASDLSIEEGALLAGLTKGPTAFNPDRHPARAQGRLAYVLDRMQEDDMLSEAQNLKLHGKTGVPALPAMTSVQRLRRDTGYYFTDEIAREVKAVAGVTEGTTDSYVIRSTINPQMQRAAEEALQEGLFQYERQNGRLEFRGAEANLSQAIARIDADRKTDADAKKPDDKRPSWQVALTNARLPLYDVHWAPAIVVDISGKKGTIWRVGLADGRVLPLSLDAQAQRKIKLNDVVLVRLSGGKGRSSRADLRVRPVVQGATIVLENKTGRILAMAGGFSYPLSQLNRVTQAARQPGSTIKPLTYLAALGRGLQPDTLVSDEEISLRAIGSRGRHGHGREDDYWTPKNYDGGGGGILTMRQALEHSRNRATVHLLDGGIERDPEASLNRVCDLAVEALIYHQCQRVYPVILGAQPVRPVDLAAFYAAIANEGTRPSPFTVESIERDGQVIYRHRPMPVTVKSVDPAAFYQLKSMLQGVVARGTAHSISRLSPFVAGKTGTSDEENDAWFIGFTNDVTVAVWLGYDNAGGKRRTLGGGSTGGAVAVPVFEPIIEAAWGNVAQRRALAPPSPQAKQQLSCTGLSEEPQEGRRRFRAAASANTECLRVDRRGQIIDTKYRLVSREAGAQTREEGAPRGRPAYAYDAQGRWFDVPLQGMPQWRSRSPYEWRGHRPGYRWRRQ